MIRRIWSRVRPAVFWSYRRGAWQYDLIVVLILAFVFLTPRSLFNDRPSRAVFHEVEAPADGARVFWVEAGALDGVATGEIADRLEKLLQRQRGELLRVVKAEPATDQAGNVRAYVVHARP